jgi:peptide/nickel transport system permease protein
MEGQASKVAYTKPVSLNQKAWKRLKKNKAAMAGLGLIIFAVLVALFAYVIAPDNSPHGNEQILQLETQKPGFSIQILRIAKERESSNIIEGLSNGFAKSYDPIPILNYSFQGDNLHISEYKGSNFPAMEQDIPLAKVLGSAYKAGDVKAMQALVEDDYIIKRTFWLGTDKSGRDILSRLIIGVRVSLSVGLIAVAISLVIGVFFGALAGYFKGWVDNVIMWVINVFWSIPTLLLAMGLYIVAEDKFENKLVLIFVAVGLTTWVDVARLVRGQFILLREMEYVSAARSLGYGDMRIIFAHILPNILGPIIVVACANFAGSILVESGLSYIGLGIQPPAPSWGSMLNEYKDFIDTPKAYLAIFPGLAIMLLVLAFNLLGNGIRDAMDVKGTTE